MADGVDSGDCARLHVYMVNINNNLEKYANQFDETGCLHNHIMAALSVIGHPRRDPELEGFTCINSICRGPLSPLYAGVAIYVNNSLAHFAKEESAHPEEGIMWICISCELIARDLYVCIVYRPPQGSTSFLEDLVMARGSRLSLAKMSRNAQYKVTCS
jgi:hypothetical protein